MRTVTCQHFCSAHQPVEEVGESPGHKLTFVLKPDWRVTVLRWGGGVSAFTLVKLWLILNAGCTEGRLCHFKEIDGKKTRVVRGPSPPTASQMDCLTCLTPWQNNKWSWFPTGSTSKFKVKAKPEDYPDPDVLWYSAGWRVLTKKLHDLGFQTLNLHF